MTRQARRKARGNSQKGGSDPAVSAGSQVFAGGRFRPLSDNDLVLIVDKAFSILENIGIAGAPAPSPFPVFGRKGVFRSGEAMSTSVPPEQPYRCSMPKAAISANPDCPTFMI